MLNKYTIALAVIGSITLMSFACATYAANDYRHFKRYTDTQKQGKRIQVAYNDEDYSDEDVSNYQYARKKVSHNRSLPERSSRGNWIKVDLGNLSWGAYDDSGYLVNSGRVSGGKSYCPDIRRRCRTVTGTFTIYSKKGAGCKSSRFPVGKGGAPMPYCMFFKGGYALHGSNAVPNYNASHGCVRMSPADAQWLNQNFVRVGSTRVTISY